MLQNWANWFQALRLGGELWRKQPGLLVQSVLERLHVPPTDQFEEVAIEEDDASLAQFKGHGHDRHANDDEEGGDHEVVGVVGDDVSKADGGEGDEAEVKRVEALKLRFPQRKNQTKEEDVGKDDEDDEHEGDVQHLHPVSQTAEVPDGVALWWWGHLVELWAGQGPEEGPFPKELLPGQKLLEDLLVVLELDGLVLHVCLAVENVSDVQGLPDNNFLAEHEGSVLRGPGAGVPGSLSSSPW